MFGKALFYNTAPLGLGHLQRSIHLCTGLLEHFHIDYLLGSPPLIAFPATERFQLLSLPPIIRAYEKGPLIDPSQRKSPKEIFSARETYIQNTITQPYDFFIMEHFPFGRHEFSREIQMCIAQVKQRNPECLIFSSFRGDKYVNPILRFAVEQLLHDTFDRVFIHVDPKLTHGDSILGQFPGLESKFCFTGYIADPNFHTQKQVRQKQIIVSMGAGTYGKEVVRQIVQTAPLLPDYKFIFILGPKWEEETPKGVNITCVSLLPNFLEVLSHSALSINFGGYGTVVDLLCTRTPALVYPHPQQPDQLQRVRLLDEKRFLTYLKENELDPPKLHELIQRTLSKPYPEMMIDTNGVETTTKLIFDLIQP